MWRNVSITSVTPGRWKYLGHDNELVARELELLDGVAQDDLGETVRVHLCDTSSELTCV